MIRKLYFQKKQKNILRFSNDIIEYQETEINDRLISLVLQAGLFYRFRLDINFSDKEYERLYIEWLTKSINKTLTIKTFIVKNGSEIVGITTLGERSKFADIGLVVVDKNFRGRGIASDLIHSADNTSWSLGYDVIKVVTQLQNNDACRLYERCNF